MLAIPARRIDNGTAQRLGVHVLLHSGLRIVQGMLLLTCAYLVYAGLAPAMGGAPTESARVPDAEEPQARYPWSHYRIIGQRNLFRNATTGPIAPVRLEEIAESKLRMKLHATISGDGISLATLEDLSTHERFYVKPGEAFGNATVEWIERRKVVIRNQGKREAITMDDETVARAVPKRARTRRVSPRSRPARSRAQQGRERLLQRLGRRAPTQAVAPAPASRSLIEQAEFRPALNEVGEVEGLLVENIRPGSALAAAGLSDGAVCTSVNGVSLTDIESLQPASLPASGQQMCFVCRDELGNERNFCL